MYDSFIVGKLISARPPYIIHDVISIDIPPRPRPPRLGRFFTQYLRYSLAGMYVPVAGRSVAPVNGC